MALCIMDATSFTLEIGERKILFEKVWNEQEGFFLSGLPHNKNEKGFFMAKDPDGNWKVLNKFIVSKTILQLEDLLSELIEAEMNK